MNFLKRNWIWILVAVLIAAVWYYYIQSQKQKAQNIAIQTNGNTGISPLPGSNFDYIQGDNNLDGVVDFVL